MRTFSLKIFVLFLIGVFAGLLSAQTNPRVPSNFSLQINGMVRYAASRQPAENVLVRIEAFSGGLVGQVTTDRTGKFSFNGLTAQTYVVTVHAPGFQDVRQTVDLLTQNTGYLNVDLVADPNALGGPGETMERLGVINAAVPADAQAAFEKGRSLLNAGSAAEAVRSLERALAIYPKYLEAQILLGLAYMDQQNWQKAEAALRAAVGINPQATTALFALGEVYLHEKKYTDALSTTSEALKLNPSYAPGHFALAQIYWEMAPSSSDEKDFRTKAESGWREVRKALQLDPNLAKAHVLAGNMLLRAKRPTDALAHFETYLELEPNGELAAPTTELVKKIRAGLKPKS
jgi:Tfp pilus assembly protein PilF